MSDLGSQLTKMFGDYKSTQVTVQKTATNTEHHRSSTTNSYDKCIRDSHPTDPTHTALAKSFDTSLVCPEIA